MIKKFTVAICVYIKDNPDWLESSLKSIFEQTVLPNEVILVTDGPVTDELNKVIKRN